MEGVQERGNRAIPLQNCNERPAGYKEADFLSRIGAFSFRRSRHQSYNFGFSENQPS